MALDRFVYFKNEAPPREEVQNLLHDFFNEAFIDIIWSGGRFFITLPGQQSDPYKQITGKMRSIQNGPRFIEVYIGDDNIDIITRHGDAYTSCIAEGLANVIARAWNGKRES